MRVITEVRNADNGTATGKKIFVFYSPFLKVDGRTLMGLLAR